MWDKEARCGRAIKTGYYKRRHGAHGSHASRGAEPSFHGPELGGVLQVFSRRKEREHNMLRTAPGTHKAPLQSLSEGKVGKE